MPPTVPQSDELPHSLVVSLPAGHVVVRYSRLKTLQVEAERICESLEEHKNGNQWIVVVGLPPHIISKLDGDERGSLGTDYRFQWDGSVGLIKVTLSAAHNITTRAATSVIQDCLYEMGMQRKNHFWARNTTYKSRHDRGKVADQIFIPRSRIQRPRFPDWPTPGWPTFAIETGVSQSLPRLREEAKWWFDSSNGDVRIALLIALGKTKVSFELWQLGLMDCSRPLRPTTQQQTRSHHPHLVQEVSVTSNCVVGAPMEIPFAALFNQLPGPGQRDIVISDEGFRDITDLVV